MYIGAQSFGAADHASFQNTITLHTQEGTAEKGEGWNSPKTPFL